MIDCKAVSRGPELSGSYVPIAKHTHARAHTHTRQMFSLNHTFFSKRQRVKEFLNLKKYRRLRLVVKLAGQ